MNNKENIIIITIYFPPLISVASYRMGAFARYLDKERFNVTVVTLCTDDHSHEESFPGVNVIRLKNRQLFSRLKFRNKDNFLLHKTKAAFNKLLELIVMNEYSGFTKEAVKKVKQLFNEGEVHHVLTTFAPIAPHLIALRLKKLDLSFNWIADMRDGMSMNHTYGSVMRAYLARKEKAIFKKASLITTTSTGFREQFEKLSSQFDIPVNEVRNGYDFDVPEDYNYNEIFTITHAGTFYGDTKPYTFLSAVKSLIKEGKLPNLKVRFVGAGEGLQIPGDLSDIVQVTSRIPHDEALKYVMKSDVNLLILPRSRKESIPVKLYEYIASGKPVIAICGKQTEAAALINECNAGFVADENNPGEIRDAILGAYELWKNHRKLEVNTQLIKQFHRKVQVRKFEQLISNDA